MEKINVREFEWYLRDYLFRQSNLNNRHFLRTRLPMEMIKTYLRYRHTDQAELEIYLESVLEILSTRRVIIENTTDGSFELRDPFVRLQCSNCLYVSYLSTLEPRECLRCSGSDLSDFPRKNKRPQ
jgi:hypothetical protein